MEGCITTLPITPKANPCINLMIQPFVMDVFGAKMGLERIISLCSSSGFGSNGNNNDETDYIKSNEMLGIRPDFVWKNNCDQNKSLVKKMIHELFSMGYILQEKAKIIKCPCGVVESLAVAENISFSRKKYKNNKCVMCGQEIFKIEDLVFLFCFPNREKMLLGQIFPKFYEKELNNMFRRFSGHKFLISKSRMSAFDFEIQGNNRLLDIDFVWQLFLSSLYRSGHNVKFLVGSNKSIMACLFSVVFFNILDKKEISIIIPPYCLAPGRQELKDAQYALSRLLAKDDAKTIRLMLATAMNWKLKESVIDFEILDVIRKHSHKIISLPKNNLDIVEISSFFNKQIVKKILASVRKEKMFFESGELFGII